MSHKNYAYFKEDYQEMAKHVDNMFDLISEYAKGHNIPLKMDDRAEKLVEAIATFIVESRNTR